MKRKGLIIWIIVYMLLASGTCSLRMTDTVSAKTSVSKINRAAIKGYTRKTRKLRTHCAEVKHIFTDVTGDGIKEGIIKYLEQNSSEYHICVYSYKKGKIKKMYQGIEYKDPNIKATVYKRKGICLRGVSYKYEWYHYFKLENGKIRLKAWKVRYNNGETQEEWEYYIGKDIVKGKSVSKETFEREIASITSGKKVSPSWKAEKVFMGMKLKMYEFYTPRIKSLKVKGKSVRVVFKQNNSYHIRKMESNKSTTKKSKKLNIRLDYAHVYTQTNVDQEDWEIDKINNKQSFVNAISEYIRESETMSCGVQLYVYNGKVVRLNLRYS